MMTDELLELKLVKNIFSWLIYFVVVVTIFFACGKSTTETPPSQEEYDALVMQGWQDFAEKNYNSAKIQFQEAAGVNPGNAAAYGGIGWALLMQDSLTSADDQFSLGAEKSDPDADFYAGWAFTLHLLHQSEKSINNALSALQFDADWIFENGTSLDKRSLQLILAADYFLVGNFAESLRYVQMLNPGYSADIFTYSGRAALSRELERLSNSGE
ncbi:MAG: hypothetical protein DWQ10_17800 [Calditrichaeota bacterium]|nr:MAG: hypothetical protein DWQ10_17800 [Calditrichota bacterium]